MRLKTCKAPGCGAQFEPIKPMQVVCSPLCAAKYARHKAHEKIRKDFKRETRRRKERLKTRSDWMKEAQSAFNGYIRARDAEEPCISCGKRTGAKMNAGHYLTVGAHPELRFDELNCHAQCEHCNSYLSGNIVEYRKRLIQKIGQNAVDWLEGPHKPIKLTVEEIQGIKREYSAKNKEIKPE